MQINTRAGVAATTRDTAIKWIKRCLREITRKDYELPVDYATARADIVVTLKSAGHRSSACAKGISIDLTAFNTGRTALIEYPAFAKDPVIGSRETLSPESVLAATIAHEISQFVQYRYGLRHTVVVQTLPQTTWGGFSRHLPDSQGEGNQPALL